MIHDQTLSNGAYVDFKVGKDSSGTPVITSLTISFDQGKVPIGGIGSTIFREIRTLDLMRLWFIESSRSFLTSNQEKTLRGYVKELNVRRIRDKDKESEYSAFAYFYVKFAEVNPNNPTQRLADDLEKSVKTIQAKLTLARKHGLLTMSSGSGPTGRAHGQLTAKCRRLIMELVGQ